jgi:hypothetical protein
MDPDHLREQLAKLHEELCKVRRVDPRSNQLLGELMQDIKRLMEAPASTAPASAAQAAAAPSAAAPSPPGELTASTDTSLSDRLEKIAVQFEVDHPTLAASARRLVDLLGKAGL